MDDNRRTRDQRRTPGQRSAEEMRRRRMRQQRQREARRIRIITILIAVLIIAAIVVTVIALTGNKKKRDEEKEKTVSQTETTETVPPRSEVELIAVGDVLMHTPLLNFARQEDGSFDFNNIFSVMRDDISRADIAVCNQETPVDTTREPDGGIEFIFNTPGAIGDAEINAGFDVVLQASNHSYDMGSDGILNTINFWNSKEGQIKMIGMNESQEKRDTITYLDKNGIRFALLNYTYGLNGFELPWDMDYLVTIMDDAHRDIIYSDVAQAAANADFVIVFPHWGVEDLWPETTEEQDQWAQFFADAGADLIIGTHPHVCERIDWVTGAGGNRTLCYYSLGNYASNQQETPEVLGGMAKVKIVKEGDNTYIDEAETGVVPIVTHNINHGNFTNEVVCYKLADYTDELAGGHDIVTNSRDNFSLGRLWEIANEVFGSWIKEY